MANVLLIEPYFSRKLPLLSVMKLSSYYKSKGDNVKYWRGNPTFIEDDYKPDIVAITSLFSWDVDEVIQTIKSSKMKYPDAQILVGGVGASLNQEIIEKQTGIKPHFGIWDEVEKCVPDYSIYPEEIDYSLGFTSKGCPNKCGWCPVWRIEGNIIEYDDWWKCVDTTKKKIILMDNNFLATSKEHFDRVIDKLKEFNKTVDWNQGLDIRLLNDYKARRLSEIKLRPVRFAFDGLHEDNFIQKGIITMKAYGFNEFVIDVLWNFMDTPQDFYYRLKELVKLKVASFPMMYQPLDAKEKKGYIGKNWTKMQVDNIRFIFGGSILSGAGCLGQETKIDVFEERFGKDAEEFVNMLNNNYFIENKEKFNTKKEIWENKKIIKNIRKLNEFNDLTT